HIQAGVKVSNLREVVQAELNQRGERCGCIRCREVKRRRVNASEVELHVHSYTTDLTQEHFLSFVTTDAHEEPGLIAGFLRLSWPLEKGAGSRAFLDEIAESALIREVHVYGPALGIGAESDDQAQHRG